VGARRQFADVPIVFAMVPYHQRYELDGANVTGIALTSDLSPELSALAGLLPNVRRVGVVADLRFSQKLVEDATGLASARGLTLVPLDADSQPKVEKVLKAARGRVDALVLISDRTVGNAAVVQRLIAWGLEEKVPVVGLAAAQVKEGALFALAPAPLAIGQQAGRLANRLLVEKVDPGALVVAQPDGLELQLNLGTVKKLAGAGPQLSDVLGYAARKGLAVKVFEGTP
jgi:putative ABC transport system substrate-binding protein